MTATLRWMKSWGLTAIIAAALLSCFGRPVSAAGGLNAIRGIVTQFDEPIANMQVVLTLKGRQVEATRTDPFGRFGFNDVMPGPYELVARGSIHDIIRNGPPVPIFVMPPPARPTRVRVFVPGP